MAKVEIEVADDGSIGQLPEVFQKAFDRKVSDAVTKAEKNLETKFAGQLADPVEKERLKSLAEENSRLKEAEARAAKNFEEADRLKEERHAAALKEREDRLTSKDGEIVRRDSRLRAMLGSEIRAAATAAGARDESLPELVTILGIQLDLDGDSLEPFIKGADGKPLEKDGKRVSIESHVQQYLVDHPHHFNATRGKSGRAPGGATMRGAGVNGEKDDAIALAAENPNPKNVTSAISAMRKKAS